MLGQLEDMRVALPGRERALEQARDTQVERGPVVLGHERVRGLLDAIVRERMGAGGQLRIMAAVARPRRCRGARLDEAQLDGRLEVLVHRGGAVLADDGQHVDVEDVAHAGGVLQDPLGGRGQPAHALEHQLDHVVRDREPSDGGEVPAPASQRAVEGQQPVLMQRAQEVADEERVACGLGDHELGQLGAVVRAALQAIGEQLADVVGAERPERDAPDVELLGGELVEHHGQGMRGVDLAVAIGADQEQVVDTRVGHHELHQAEAGGVRPLQVVEEHDQRVLDAAQHLQEALEHEVEAMLGLDRREVGHGRLRADEERERGPHIDEHLGVRAERVAQRLSPLHEPLLGLGEELTDERAEGADQGRVRHVVVLIELALDEVAVPLRDRRGQLLDQRRLADARIAAHQQELLGAGDHAPEGRQQRVPLVRPSVQPGRDLEPLGVIGLAQGEALDLAAEVELALALEEVVGAAPGGLVAVLRQAGHELGHDVRDGLGDLGVSLVRWHVGRLVRRRVGRLQRIVDGEWHAAGAELVERHAEGVEIGAVIDGPVDAAGLLRGHVRRGFLEPGRAPGRGKRGGELQAAAEAGELELARVRVEQDVGRIEVAMDDAAVVKLAEDVGDPGREHEDLLETQALPAVQDGQRLRAEILEHQHGSALHHLEAEGLDHPVNAQALQHLEAHGDSGPGHRSRRHCPRSA